ncbi:MCE family protein [Parapedobacter sp. ISTM3]|uniref:Phospholipid/cholesterol/gamma-HCH transport system substrate-binding protein n=1 Tax=Parapedobacter luteus TaxID=623280 RepID=A0A1T5ALE6_9SPHI|nr:MULTISPECIES: MlaD family protein [Parapedobacter]MBK1441700.1 MCE family protein [Parapedobacter sp. ISTM3]SKB35705.1 phospholipid/cholesterol/gamma-HCH transport system substrate-binding protein [Parapedobacter luteus]
MKIANETKVGILAVVAIAILVLGYSFLRGNDVFSRENTFYATYERVDGLTASKPILVNGYQIGRVSAMQLQADGRIKTEFKVRRDYAIPVNTVARLASTDLLGSKAIVFELGDSPEYAKDGDKLEAGLQKNIMEQVEPIQKKAEDIVAVLDSVLSSINNTINKDFQRDFNRSINSIANSLQNLEGITGQLDGLVVSERNRISRIVANVESITGNLKDNNERIGHVLANLDSITDQVAKADFAQTIVSANRAMADFQSITDRINQGEGSIGMLLNDEQLYNNLNQASKNLEELIADMKARPGRYVHFSVFGRKND